MWAGDCQSGSWGETDVSQQHGTHTFLRERVSVPYGAAGLVHVLGGVAYTVAAFANTWCLTV